MAVSFNCIEIPASKCAAKFVNKSTSQPARSRADGLTARESNALKRSPFLCAFFSDDKRRCIGQSLHRDQ